MGQGIRKAVISDLPYIYDLERLYIIEHEPDQLKEWDQAQDRQMEVLKNHLEQLYVKEVKGIIVAHGYWGLLEDTPCIYSIYVAVPYRRRGIASTIMGRLEQNIYEKGYEEVCLSTMDSNPAQRLFEALEYEDDYRQTGWVHYKKDL